MRKIAEIAKDLVNAYEENGRNDAFLVNSIFSDDGGADQYAAQIEAGKIAERISSLQKELYEALGKKLAGK